jgi:GMP synthase-like glutamine amidotransferase
LADHPWFLGCQFHPELKSKPLAPHPLFVSFIQAAYEHRLKDEVGEAKKEGEHLVTSASD